MRGGIVISSFVFCGGSDVTVLFDGKAPGGIKKAVCTAENTVTDIGCYLEDEPAARIVSTERYVTVELNPEDMASFDENSEIGVVTVSGKCGTLTYEDCVIESVETTALPGEKLSCKIKISAGRFKNDSGEQI